MTDDFYLRDFTAADAEALDRVAVSAFEQFKGDYSDWPAMERSVARMSQLSQSGELIVAEFNGRIVGGVAYIGPDKPKAAYFDPTWPIIRMLVVDPSSRGSGLGRALTEECIRRAQRDNAPIIALHTTPRRCPFGAGWAWAALRDDGGPGRDAEVRVLVLAGLTPNAEGPCARVSRPIVPLRDSRSRSDA